LFIPPLGLPIFLSSFLFLYLNTKNDGRHSFLVSTIILAFHLLIAGTAFLLFHCDIKHDLACRRRPLVSLVVGINKDHDLITLVYLKALA